MSIQVTIQPRPDAGRVTILSEPIFFEDEIGRMDLTGYGWSITPHPLWRLDNIVWDQVVVTSKSTGHTETHTIQHSSSLMQYGPETIDTLDGFFAGTVSYRAGSVTTTTTYTITGVTATFRHSYSGRIIRVPATGSLMRSTTGNILSDR